MVNLPSQKTKILVVHPDNTEKAQDFFQDLNLNIISGHRSLGGLLAAQRG